MAAARPRTLPAAVAPVLVGSALAWREGVFRVVAAAGCLVFALLVQIGTNFANDYYDFLKGADTPERTGPVRAVAAGLVPPRTMRRAMAAVFAAAFAAGLSLVALRGWSLVLIGLASIGCGLAYTGGPYPLGYRGLGDVFVFLFFGLVAVGTTFYVQAGRVGAEAMVAALPVGLLAANLLVVNNCRDAITDARAGKRTLVVRWGRRFAYWQYGTALAAGAVVPAVFFAWGWGAGVLAPLALLPLGLRQLRALIHPPVSAGANDLLEATAKYLACYSVLFSAGLALG
jgi:1,4-dihydroxy-2-naphthoate octaprenyltransferase